MHWLQTLDFGLLRFINETLSNSFFDAVMPFASGNRYFFPVLIIALVILLWKGGARGRLCVLMVALIIGPGDGLISNTIKHAVARPRPFVTHPELRQPASRNFKNAAKSREKRARKKHQSKPAPAHKPNYNSMPSSHAANWFAGTMILFVFYRRSLWFMLPLACLVCFSRLYNGVHYPSDVLAGAILGAGYAVAGMWFFNALWNWTGRKWFPLWWAKVPSLLNPKTSPMQKSDSSETLESQSSIAHAQWLRLGYVLIAILFLVRIGYIVSGTIELSGDEAYQWIWSKHLALSYFSKPPLIAYTQFLGTHIWGDTDLGVRFFSPVLAAIASLVLLRFMAKFVSARAAFALLLVASTTPLLSVGAVLMTIDPLSVLFWVLAMISGWRAAQPESKTSDWLWTGLWMGLGFLSKYTEMLQWLCWIVFFIAWKPSRRQLRRPGPYLALLVNALCAIPVLIWNAQHHWITVFHVAGNAGMKHHWRPHVGEFLGVEWLLLNPVYFIAAIWASIAFWRRMRKNVFALYLFSMGMPLFLAYFIWSFHSSIKPNWIAPAVLPMFCLMIVYWQARWKNVARWANAIFAAGFVIGAATTVITYNTDLIGKIVGRPLPPKPDPLTRVRGARDSAQLAEQMREKLEAEGKPAFIICSHYETTGLFTFYSPLAKSDVTKTPLVYFISSEHPENQFYFWPSYTDQRKGQNAIFIRELGSPPLVKGWVPKWLRGETNLLRHPPISQPAPRQLVREFDSVKDLGQFNVLYRGRVFHTYQIFECHNLH